MADAAPESDPYIHVRAQVIARRFSELELPRSDWFQALAGAGLTGLLTAGDYRKGLRQALAAAETFGGYNLPLSFAPAVAGAAALSASGNGAARILLTDMLSDGGPVIPALQSGVDALGMGAGGGLKADPATDGGIRVTGQRIAVPDADHARTFLAEASGPDGIAVFLVEPDGPGVSFAVQETVAGGTIGALSFDMAPIPGKAVLARGAEAEVLLDRMRFAVQLGLGAELSGLGAALMIRAGAAHANETEMADALMDVSLARAFVLGAAGMAEPRREHALEIIAGARALASFAALATARLALASVPERAGIEPLARRALVASRIYRQPQAHMLRFVEWRWGAGEGTGALCELFNAANAMAGGGAAGPSAPVVAAIEANESVRALAHQTGLAEDAVFRDRLGHAEIDLFGLVCADAQHQAGSDVSGRFLQAAARRVEARLAECALQAVGSHAVLAGPEGHGVAERFIAAHGR